MCPGARVSDSSPLGTPQHILRLVLLLVLLTPLSHLMGV